MNIKDEIMNKVSNLTDNILLEYLYIIICDLEKEQTNHLKDE